MQPVEPSTMVRGPDALTISFMTRADSQPWQVRCPEVKYSSMATFLTPLKGSRICVALAKVSAMIVRLLILLALFARLGRLLFPHAQPVGLGIGLSGLGGSVAHVRRLVDVLQRHFPAAQPADEAHERRPRLGVVHGRPDLVRHHARI